MTRYIFVTGGVVSALGKGLTAASIGQILKSSGLSVSLQKVDVYFNVNAGTMSPYQHGEIFVTDDGAETDLDLGHYERFVDVDLTKNNYVTAGKIYGSVIAKERNGDYGGATVQTIPHVTNEIKEHITRGGCTANADVVITEIGGTVGDIEGLPFLEAIRQLRTDLGRDRVLYVHCTLIPFLQTAGELKTKPTQHSVKELRSIGIQPDIIVCRSDRPLTTGVREKIALFCDIEKKAVIELRDVSHIYQVPIILEKQGISNLIAEKFQIKELKPQMESWTHMVEKMQKLQGEPLKIAVVGKYVRLPDAYLSISEALIHGGLAADTLVDIDWILAEDLEDRDSADFLDGVHGILVAPGFGIRGVEGKIKAVNYARVKGVPFFGISLGMQCAIIEMARNMCNMERAHSTEFSVDTPFPIIDLSPPNKAINGEKGEMRLGLHPCKIQTGTLAHAAYGTEIVSERHRHRYEFNNEYREKLADCGLIIAGTSPEDNFVEIIELPNHPWFLGCHFHPEFKSRPQVPHPLFKEFVKAALAYREAKHNE